MDSKTFGQLALQLLEAAQIPGAQIDVAVAFKQQALALASGEVAIVPVETAEPPQKAGTWNAK